MKIAVDREMVSNLQSLRECTLCFRRCGIDRTSGDKGPCRAGLLPRVAASVQHTGEEPPICGERGSGTIFFSGCSLRCVYCQNYQISQSRVGGDITPPRLAELMIDLQERGSHNINLVSPTQYVPQIHAAINMAKSMGLSVPVVYNSHGFDAPEALQLLDGAVDIYLPDLKYSDDEVAKRLSGVEGYVRASRKAISGMFDQVGHLEIDPGTGLAKRGLLVRVLVLPEGLAGVKESLLFLKDSFGTRLAISLMAQYHPVYRAKEFPPLDRPITASEYEEAVDDALALGFEEAWIQDRESTCVGIPDFTSERPFLFAQ